MPLVNGITQCYLPPDRGDRPEWQWRTARRSYDTSCGMVPFSVTLNDIYARFQGHVIIRHWVSQKRYKDVTRHGRGLGPPMGWVGLGWVGINGLNCNDSTYVHIVAIVNSSTSPAVHPCQFRPIGTWLFVCWSNNNWRQIAVGWSKVESIELLRWGLRAGLL